MQGLAEVPDVSEAEKARWAAGRKEAAQLSMERLWRQEYIYVTGRWVDWQL